MHQSSWAFFLQSDETHNKGVRGSVLWASRLLTIMGVLLAIVGVVTPLGLYDHIAPGAPTDADFGESMPNKLLIKIELRG